MTLTRQSIRVRPTYRVFTIEPSDMAQGVALASGEGGLLTRVLSGLV